MTTTNDTIYVSLLDEGVDCYRPVDAEKVGESVYKILEQQSDFDPSDETWEFLPGTVVQVKEHKVYGGKTILLACKKLSGTVVRITSSFDASEE